MNARTRELLLLETSLRQALAREQFVLHYQPQFDLATGRLTGVEALVRWNHPEMGMVPPAEFIPMAEETGLIVPVGEWILRTACAQARAWQSAGFPPLRMAVNISPRQFRHPRLAERIRSILAETALDAGLLELELTESMIMHDVEEAIRTMHELTTLGIALVIDDFGTGYSSLHYLRSFPIRKLKIDREFVRDVTTNANDAAIASAVIALARTMSLEVVAEGIETREQLAFLREKECQAGQGYLFSRPLPAAELSGILRGGKLAMD
jgi:EAL domain-containing protein (putative c-di-GMP-specific phosphodiesterase class I)